MAQKLSGPDVLPSQLTDEECLEKRTIRSIYSSDYDKLITCDLVIPVLFRIMARLYQLDEIETESSMFLGKKKLFTCIF